MDDFPKLLIVLGIGLVLAGVIWWGLSRLFGGEQLPGTFTFQRGGFTCIVPVVASIILSIVLTVVLNLILRALNK
ncbi:MAG: DUF2905 domain-containing protein [Chloroflexi bacterium]|nr:DUF2905 domain-containing protein [Chloroflexota bacterium]